MFRVRTVFTGVAGTPWYSNLFFSDDGERTAPNAKSAVTAFWTTLMGYVPPNITATVQGDVYQINAATGVTEDVVSVASSTVVGSATSFAAGYANQGLITLRTGLYRAGRPVIGKCFVPAVPRGLLQENGSLDPGYTVGLLGAANTLRTAEAGGVIVGWGVWSRPYEAVGIELPGVLTPIGSVNVPSKPSVLRSRRD